jgi:hypothetical protein
MLITYQDQFRGNKNKNVVLNEPWVELTMSLFVETRLRKISVSSPVSFLNSGISAALEAAASGEDRERGPARLYYYK